MTIWKYVLKPICALEMPKGAQILSVHAQASSVHEDICMWALVDPTQTKEIREFAVFGTGHPVPPGANMKFLGTAMLNEGRLVFHVFEVLP